MESESLLGLPVNSSSDSEQSEGEHVENFQTKEVKDNFIKKLNKILYN